MPRRKQSKRFEALHKARWTARTGSSTAVTSTSSTIITDNDDRNEELDDVTATPKRETQSDSDGTMEVTPIHFQKYDPDFNLDTPEGRNSGELPNSNSIFLGQVSQMCKFIDQINLSSKCATPLCHGKLKLVCVSMIGQQGCVTLQYDCTGCAERRVTFESSIKHETENCTAVGLALQVAFICSGAMYSQYAKVLKNALGMYCAGKSIYYKTLALMYPHVKGILNDMCEQAKESMKQKNDSELGSFKNAVTCGDAAWLTRGYHSQNATYTLRNYQTGGLLYYKHFSQRGKDDITGEELFEGTSKSAEGFGAEWVFKKAVTDEMNISIHVQDNDSTSSKALLSNFPNCRIILCSGHIARNHEKRLKTLAKQKFKKKSQVKKYEKTHPGIATVKCHCMKDDIGCFTNGFIKAARINFSAIVKSVGCDQQAFIDRLRSLAKYHAKNVHEWDGEKCFFHDLTVCDCGKCKKSDITCQGKPYKTKNILSCPFHSLAYEIACEAVIDKSKQIIHEDLEPKI
uniref:Uncharacterized protein n=1 Tax=Amphimedon queenslandica TaxID=400682 RepID=A0A1X7TCB3_AMPQE